MARSSPHSRVVPPLAVAKRVSSVLPVLGPQLVVVNLVEASACKVWVPESGGAKQSQAVLLPRRVHGVEEKKVAAAPACSRVEGAHACRRLVVAMVGVVAQALHSRPMANALVVRRLQVPSVCAQLGLALVAALAREGSRALCSC